MAVCVTVWSVTQLICACCSGVYQLLSSSAGWPLRILFRATESFCMCVSQSFKASTSQISMKRRVMPFLYPWQQEFKEPSLRFSCFPTNCAFCDVQIVCRCWKSWVFFIIRKFVVLHAALSAGTVGHRSASTPAGRSAAVTADNATVWLAGLLWWHHGRRKWAMPYGWGQPLKRIHL